MSLISLESGELFDVARDPKKRPADNKFHVGNGSDGKHYWLTPPDMKSRLHVQYKFDFDPCPFPRPDGFDGLTMPWGQSNYVNPPFGSILHQGPNDKKPKKKGATAWARKVISEWQESGKASVLVYPIDKWVLMLLAAGAQVYNEGDVRWLATEDGSQGKGTGRHIARFVLGYGSSDAEDARRYRWLRENSVERTDTFIENVGADLDAAVDAAMRKEGAA